jgi:hypothetical protein
MGGLKLQIDIWLQNKAQKILRAAHFNLKRNASD